MSDLKEYRLTLGCVEHTVLLSDADAARYGGRAVPVKQAAPAANKKRTPANKAAVPKGAESE